MKRWRCTVCGYIHTGEEPPDVCPVCKAPKTKFVEIDANGEVITPDTGTAEQPSGGSPPPGPPSTQSDTFAGFVLRHHIHPILVHAPNGLIPVIAFFLFLGIIFKIHSVTQAAIYNLVVLLVVMPAVMVTGYLEWKKRYGGAKTALFLAKISCSLIVFSTILILAGWRFINPDVAAPTSATRWIYLLISLVMLAAAGIAGFLGGKLVFGSREK